MTLTDGSRLIGFFPTSDLEVQQLKRNFELNKAEVTTSACRFDAVTSNLPSALHYRNENLIYGTSPLSVGLCVYSNKILEERTVIKNRRELEVNIRRGVSFGYLECNTYGRYRITDGSWRGHAAHSLFKMFDADCGRAFTFGALVTGPSLIAAGLIKRLSDNIIQFGMRAGQSSKYLFHTRNHQGQLRLWVGKAESPDTEDEYAIYLIQVLKSLVVAEAGVVL